MSILGWGGERSKPVDGEWRYFHYSLHRSSILWWQSYHSFIEASDSRTFGQQQLRDLSAIPPRGDVLQLHMKRPMHAHNAIMSYNYKLHELLP